MEPWTIRPTNLERKIGRLLRSPEGHDDPPVDPPAEPSLIGNDPPADPPKVDDPPKAGDPPKEDDPPVAVEPLKVEDIVLPEGFELDPEKATPFLEILNGEQSPKEKLNALVELHTKALTDASEAGSKLWEKTQTEWRDEVKADPEIGGDKLQPALTNIGKLVNEFGSQELKDVFDATGAGNNIHVIKFLNTVATKLTEGGYRPGATPSNAADSEQAKASRLFPSMKG
jgi:hypothetical protein